MQVMPRDQMSAAVSYAEGSVLFSHTSGALSERGG